MEIISVEKAEEIIREANFQGWLKGDIDNLIRNIYEESTKIEN